MNIVKTIRNFDLFVSIKDFIYNPWDGRGTWDSGPFTESIMAGTADIRTGELQQNLYAVIVPKIVSKMNRGLFSTGDDEE